MRDLRWPVMMMVMLVLASRRTAMGQQRPLPVEPADGVGAGNVVVQTGVDYTRDEQFTLSGLQGNLWRVALLRVDCGLSSIADFELSGGLRDQLAITSMTPAVLSDDLRLSNPTSTGAFDDIMIGAKIRIMWDESTRSGIAVRVATRLPNSKHQSGLGQDTTDFFVSGIVERSVGPLHAVANLGLGVLGDPLDGDRRVNSLLYGASIGHTVRPGLDVLAALEGRTGPLEPGLESRALARLGAGWTSGPARIELDGTLGLTSRDGNLGAALNIGFTLHAFNPQ